MRELTIHISADSREHLYEQIYKHIKREIRNGAFLKDEKLPSTRFLAEYLQVSRSTVELAYQQLLSEGYIAARPCRGYFVSPIEELYDLKLKKSNQKDPVDKSKGFSGSFKSGTSEDTNISRKHSWKQDFSPNGTDVAGFPYETWKRISKNSLEDNRLKMFSQGDAKGEEELRETVARYLHASRGVNCSSQQVIIGAGTDYLLMLLAQLLGRGQSLAMENLTYPRAHRIFSSFQYKIRPISLDEGGMSIGELRKSDAQIAYVMPAHQFPTGVVMPIGRRQELLNWAMEVEGRYLIEDDYDSEFRFIGKPIPSLQAIDENGKVIYMGTFSKSIAPAIRISYMVLPPQLLAVYERVCGMYASTVSRIDQTILNQFMKEGCFERHLNKMRKIYKGKHDLLLEGLKEFRKKFDIRGEHAGLHVLLVSKDGASEGWLRERAEKAGVKVYGMSEYFMGEKALPRKDTILMGFAALSEKEIKEGLEALKKAWGV